MIYDSFKPTPSMDTVKAKVELYTGSTLVETCTCADVLQEFNVTRSGVDNKFFGFGISHKIKIELIDMENNLNLNNLSSTIVGFTEDGENFWHPYPAFHSITIERHENENSYTLNGFDLLETAGAHTSSELTELVETEGFTLGDVINACARVLGIPSGFALGRGYDAENSAIFSTALPGANLDGTETIRQILDAAAELAGAIYFINSEGRLVFTCLARDYEFDFSITKDKYFDLFAGEARVLSSICSATELGDNLKTEPVGEGATQFVRDNPFFEAMESTAVADFLNTWHKPMLGGLTIQQFTCDWDGNYLLEVGDKIALERNDGSIVYSYVLNDSITYDGALNEITKWEYVDNDNETASNPTTLGEILNQTFAKVDKVNQEIELIASKADANGAAISQLTVDTEGISTKVSSMETTVNDSIDSINGSLDSLTKSVETKVTSEQVSNIIQTEVMENGVSKVITTIGTFDENGLTVSKSGSEMTTRIAEDGMTVYRDSEAVLVANNEGVNAENLHATTYLMIGGRSRFENYESNRTGCFWIGGND